MKNPVDAWHEEHLRFGQVLALMEREMDRFHAGDDPDYQLLLDVLSYLGEYADNFHHPREDEAFKRLLAHCPDRKLPVARLLQEHRVIAHAGQTLRDLLEQASQDAIVQRSDIEAAAGTYLVYYRNHIAREEEDILPRAARHLTAGDWEAVKSAAPGGIDPLFGPTPDARFRTLRQRVGPDHSE